MIDAPLWVAELAELFWAQTTVRPALPRDLRAALRWSSFPLVVHDRPRLSVATVGEELARQGRPWAGGGPDRRLRGALVAEGDAGLIFLDADDDPAEVAFTLAHEAAHFLRHYWQPRRRAEAALGTAVLEVLDGLRPPGPRERLHAALRRMTIGCHIHLMERRGGVEEDEADQLARELLAPVAAVRARLGEGEATGVLIGTFGLPPGVAAGYAEALLPPEAAPPRWLTRLQNAARLRRTSCVGEEC